MHSHTNISQVTMFSTMGNLNEVVSGGQDQNYAHKTGMCSAPSAISEWSRHGLKEDRHQSRHNLKKEKIQVRTSIRSYFWSDNSMHTNSTGSSEKEVGVPKGSLQYRHILLRSSRYVLIRCRVLR